MRVLILAGAAFLLFAPTLSYNLVWDDLPILERIREGARGGPGGLLALEYTPDDPTGYYRPVTVISLHLDQLSGGGGPWAFHLTNVLLHVLSSVLVLLLLEALALPPGPAFLGALLFAVHPTHLESVAFAANRSNLWMGVFVLLSSLAWAKGRLGGPSSSPFLPLLGGSSLTLGMLSKEPAFLLPALLLVWEVLGAWEGRAWKGRAFGKWLGGLGPWLAAWGAAGAVALLARWAAGVGWGVVDDAGVFIHPAGMVPRAVGTAARVALFPFAHNPWFSPAQVRLGIPETLSILLLGGLAFVPFDRSGAFRGGRILAWSLGFLLPTLGFVPLRGATFREGFLYTSLFGFSLAAAYLLRLLRGRGRPAATALALLAAALLAGSTLLGEPLWKEEGILFGRIVERSPGLPVGYLLMGLSQGRKGNLPEARNLLEKAAALERHPRNLETLGVAFARMGDAARAEGLFRVALARMPGDRGITCNLAETIARQGRREEAERFVRGALAGDPRWEEGRALLSRVLSGPAGGEGASP